MDETVCFAIEPRLWGEASQRVKLVGGGTDQIAASEHHMATIEGFLFMSCGACGGKFLLERSLQPCLLMEHITAEAIIAMLDVISFITRFQWFFNKLDWVLKVDGVDSAVYNEKAIIYDEKAPRLRPNETSSSCFLQGARVFNNVEAVQSQYTIF